MSEISQSLIEGAAYILLILVAVRSSWKKGEAEGSRYMLEYLRENKYKNTDGIKIPYLDDTGYNNFMKHVREEDGKKKKI